MMQKLSKYAHCSLVHKTNNYVADDLALYKYQQQQQQQ